MTQELYVDSVVQQRLWFVVDAEATKQEDLQRRFCCVQRHLGKAFQIMILLRNPLIYIDPLKDNACALPQEVMVVLGQTHVLSRKNI